MNNFSESWRMNQACAMALCHVPCSEADVWHDCYRRTDPSQSYYDPCPQGQETAHVAETLRVAKERQEQYRLRVGDRVEVAPRKPRAHGRGIGTLVYLGDTIVRVRFGNGRTVACLRADCEVA